ncbi:RNA polymerase sigma factor [Maribacter antarcticus]|uniref:RNA polymerase sigma factor n=1 Tax=Maribacter antarcticus TaxID=505250 RepID=UPI000566CDA7|nr:RNA polymerase sigma-70 factor [Maribacter antarcticus]
MSTEPKYVNEKILIEELKKGSEEAYGFFFKSYYQDLCNYITAVSGDFRVAEEVAQQAFIKFWDKKEIIHIKEDSLKRYLFVIALNLFIDTQRKKKKELAFLDSLKQEAHLEILETDSSLFDERLKQMEVEIENLPERCKKVFIMGKKDGLRYKEISEELHISIKTVEAHMSKAIKRLRTQLSLFF